MATYGIDIITGLPYLESSASGTTVGDLPTATATPSAYVYGTDIVTGEEYITATEGELTATLEFVGSGDTTVTLSNNEVIIYSNGGAVDKIVIPKLQIYSEGVVNNFSLKACWVSENKEFLNYNPTIQLFRYSKSKKQIIDDKLYFSKTNNRRYRRVTSNGFIVGSNEAGNYTNSYGTYYNIVSTSICPTESANIKVIGSSNGYFVPNGTNGINLDMFTYIDNYVATISRRSQKKLQCLPISNRRIHINCGVAIVIEVNGKKIWNEITPFKLGVGYFVDIMSGTYVFKRYIDLKSI